MHLGGRRAPGAIAAGIVLAVVLFVAAVAMRAGPHLVHELGRERSPIATLSSLLLLACAGVALALGRRARGFLVMGAGLVLLAADERFMGHERLKRWILGGLFDWDRAAMGRLGDLPLALAGACGVVLLWSLRGQFASPAAQLRVAAAVLAGSLALALDLTSVAPVPQAVEEVLELAAETLLLLALLKVATGRPPHSTVNAA